MKAISRALKIGTKLTLPTLDKLTYVPQGDTQSLSAAHPMASNTSTRGPHSAGTTSPKRKRGQASDATGSDVTPVAKEHLSLRDKEDNDLGMLDQEAFARVLASSQRQQTERQQQEQKDEEEGEEEEHVEMDDVTYQPSMGLPEGADPTWSLRMVCLPVLDIFV
jgi:hypothetical protein